MRKQLYAVAAAILAAGMLAGCSGGAKETEEQTSVQAEKETETAKIPAAAEAETEAASEKEETELLVAAAASLKNAYEEELIPMFEAQYPGVIVTGVYDSSGKLQTQIEEGLEADVFMSAATKQMDALNEKGLIAEDTIADLLENKIVLIVPTGNEAGLEAFEDIEKASSIALGDPASVPAGQYAEEALTSLGIWDRIQVAASSADAGIVYATDAASMAEQVDVIAEAPEGSLKKKVIYPVAVLKGSAHSEEAADFVEFLKTEEAMKVFEAYGFSKGNEILP